MHKRKSTEILQAIIVTGLCLVNLPSCTRDSTGGMIIITQVPGKLQEINFVTGDFWRFYPEAQIVSFDPDRPQEKPKVLTENFCSACSPAISYDGRSLLFSAREKQDDPWNIWEMNLRNLKIRKVISSGENCADPAYLPGNRLLFSKLNPEDTLKAGYSLYTCNMDGTDEKRITFNPGNYFAPVILNDGRILAISRQLYPEQENEIYMVLRPDGTKAEMFCKSSDGKMLVSLAQETGDGKIVFIESGIINNEGDNLVSVSYNRPLHSGTCLPAGTKNKYRSVYPMNSGNMLVSMKKSPDERFAIYDFDPLTNSFGRAVYSTPDYDLTEALLVEPHTIPRKLPSEVDMQVRTGLLLCQDINVPDPLMTSDRKASKIEVLGLDKSYGTIDVEPDGSFLIKAMADTPFRLQSLDEKGNIVNGPCAWISLRPNERRGCVGCHEDMELVPENRVPLSVRKPPVNLPVHVEKIKEKTVDLE